MKVTIDHQKIKVKKGITVLDAAKEHDIYIPALCNHPELAPYGGCRLCIVEVDGMPEYPTACTAYVEEGMVVRTKTEALQKLRKEVLQLILSEHPSSCLICEEAKECSMETIRKVGVITGCRWCPKDGDCELQKIVDYLKIESIDLPVNYHGFSAERYDPFYDRDYNICIYCGRCVRICEEHRKSSILTLKQRGKFTTIGTAFDLSHIEAGCEFCGACVSICPMGALSEKSKKWSGVAEAYKASFCPLCSLNCDIQILTKNNKVIGVLPPGEPGSSGGDLCVKGRFCLSQLINHPDRIIVPRYRSPEGLEELSWNKAVERVVERIKGVSGKRIAMYLSPNLTLKDLTAAKQFARKIIKTENITSSIFSSKFAAFLSLATPSVSLEDIKNSDCIASVFLNGNYNYTPVTLAIKRAAERGSQYYQIGWVEDTTSRFASRRFTPFPGKEHNIFDELLQVLKKATSPVIILGTWTLDLTQWQQILKKIKKIVKLTDCKVFTPLPYGNLKDLLSVIDLEPNEKIDRLINQGKIDALFLVGESPFYKRPPVDFIIQQSYFPASDELCADFSLPTAMWCETAGIEPPGSALTNAEIFTRIAKTMGERLK